jgi:mono/diheme cytochrome c family protein
MCAALCAATSAWLVSAPVAAQDAGATFAQRCASCHSIGQGARVGPDLAGAHERRTREWLHSFVKAPSSMLDSDADAQALLSASNGVRMPDLGLDDATVDGLIDYIERCSTEDCAAEGGGLRAVSESTANDVAAGRALFLGDTALSNGGPACISCHRTQDVDGLGGGTLAKDLTQAFARLGEGGMDGALTGTPFPLMNTIYPERPLTEDEAFRLKADLASVSRQAPVGGRQWMFPLFGLVGLAIAFVLINAAWRRRSSDGVRRPLVEMQPRRRRASDGGRK